MKVALLYLKGKTESWAESACDDFSVKLSRFVEFERMAIKSKSADRDDAEKKREAEADAILAKVASSDCLILFDEKGRIEKNSIAFSESLVRIFSQQKSRFIFVIGGPYGFSERVIKKCQLRISLSPLTMNHHVAQVAALEQLYRAFTIWKGLPYHNE